MAHPMNPKREEIPDGALQQIRFPRTKDANAEYSTAKPINWFGSDDPKIPAPGEQVGFKYMKEKKKGGK